MAAPTVTLNCQTITISWVALVNATTAGRTAPNNFNLFWKSNGGVTWYQLIPTNSGYTSTSYSMSMLTSYIGYGWA